MNMAMGGFTNANNAEGMDNMIDEDIGHGYEFDNDDLIDEFNIVPAYNPACPISPKEKQKIAKVNALNIVKRFDSYRFRVPTTEEYIDRPMIATNSTFEQYERHPMNNTAFYPPLTSLTQAATSIGTAREANNSPSYSSNTPSTVVDYQIQLFRESNGLCGNCGIMTKKVKIQGEHKIFEAISTNEVIGGRCIRCNPQLESV